MMEMAVLSKVKRLTGIKFLKPKLGSRSNPKI